MSDLIHSSERRLGCAIGDSHDIEVCKVITSELDGKAERVTAQVRLYHINQVELVIFNCQPKPIINCCGQQ